MRRRYLITSISKAFPDDEPLFTHPIIQRRYIIPDWEGSAFQKWAKNFCFRNAWRVTHILGDYDDCMGKCIHDFLVCKARYGLTVTCDKHFMFCYTQWVVGEFNTLAVLDGKERGMRASLSTKEEIISGNGELAVKLSQASSELKSVLKLFFDAPKEIMETLRKDAQSCHPKQAFRAAVKLAGVPITKTADLVKELQNLLG